MIEEMSEELTANLMAAGADSTTIKLADVEEISISYMADDSTRIRVKMVGDLLLTGSGGK